MEERFWRNYFYRVSLLKQALELNHHSATSSPRVPADKAAPASTSTPAVTPTAAAPALPPRAPAADPSTVRPEMVTGEYASDAWLADGSVGPAEPEAAAPTTTKPSAAVLDPEDVAGSAAAAPGTPANPGEDFDWEKELEKELGDYKGAGKGTGGATTATDGASEHALGSRVLTMQWSDGSTRRPPPAHRSRCSAGTDAWEAELADALQ